MRQSIIDLADRRTSGDHPGLLLQRYLTRQADPDERRALLDAAMRATRSESLRAIYTDAFARWSNAFAEKSLQRSEQLATASRLVVGLGSENVLETGLRLHHTYGVPIIPGSALKGLASHYCHDVWGQRHAEAPPEENPLFRRDGSYHRLLFGTSDDGGVITFHDAWITPASLSEGALRLDVITPHHPKWQTNEAPPTDFDSPVPVSFLSVAGTFEVRLSWSGPAAAPPAQRESWPTLAMKLLQEALDEWGIGGKTSSGYGRLVHADALRTARQVPTTANPARQVTLPTPGEIVETQLLEERTRKGGWKARHEPSGLGGPIQNTSDVPADKKVGDRLKLIVAAVNDRELSFRYPTAADQDRAQRGPSDAKGRQGGGGRGRRT